MDSNKKYVAIFKEGSALKYNGFSIGVVNGTISDEGDYFLLKPNNRRSFGYWYKDENVGVIANDYKAEKIKIYKEEVNSHMRFTAIDSLMGYAMFTLESDDYDIAQSFSELLITSTSFEYFLDNTSIAYYDYGYYNYVDGSSKNTTVNQVGNNSYDCSTVVGIKENGVAFISVNLVLVGDEIRALYPIVQPYMGLEGTSLTSVAEIGNETYNYLVNFEIR